MDNEKSLAFEMLKELKMSSKRKDIIIVFLIIVILCMSIFYIWHENQYETITEEQQITQEQQDTENCNMSGVIN